MAIMFVITAFASVGIPVAIWAAVRAHNRVAGNYDSWEEALNDQDYWAEIYEESQG